MEFYLIFSVLLAFGIPITLAVWYQLSVKDDLIQKKNHLIVFSILLLSLSLLLIGGAFSHIRNIIFPIGKELDSAKLGQYGDLVGGLLNPLLSGIGIIAASLAFYVQYQANRQVQNQFRLQQFESQYFEMIRLHKENINEMKISGYDLNISSTSSTENRHFSQIYTQVEKLTEGRKTFVTMYKELIACFKFCKLYDATERYTDQELLELAYQFFFFGSASDLAGSDTIDKRFVEFLRARLKEIRGEHKRSVGRTNEFKTGKPNDNIQLYVKYAPFTGHESRLGHYYRHLYGTVKFVVDTEKHGLLNYSQVRNYLKILRIQMSNHEQLMLYYNYLVGFGEDWENEGYLTKYRMLHNLPVERIKYGAHPRRHFKSFIESIENEGDMFEWGDLQKRPEQFNIFKKY